MPASGGEVQPEVIGLSNAGLTLTIKASQEAAPDQVDDDIPRRVSSHRSRQPVLRVSRSVMPGNTTFSSKIT